MFPIALAVSEQLGVNFLPFAVVLPDVLIDDVESDLSRDNLAAMVQRFDEFGAGWGVFGVFCGVGVTRFPCRSLCCLTHKHRR